MSEKQVKRDDVKVGDVWMSVCDNSMTELLVVDAILHEKFRVRSNFYGEQYVSSDALITDYDLIIPAKFEGEKQDQKDDMVNHPPHYKDESGIECIEVTKKGRKDDSAKRRYSLLPKGTVNSVVDVLEFGSKKYADNNWMKVPDAKARYYDAAMRHLDAWFNGDIKDAETGLPHLAHAICCLMFLMWFDSEANQ